MCNFYKLIIHVNTFPLIYITQYSICQKWIKIYDKTNTNILSCYQIACYCIFQTSKTFSISYIARGVYHSLNNYIIELQTWLEPWIAYISYNHKNSSNKSIYWKKGNWFHPWNFPFIYQIHSYLLLILLKRLWVDFLFIEAL